MATQLENLEKYAPDYGILNGKGLQQLIKNIKTADGEIEKGYQDADTAIKTAYEEADSKKVNLSETTNITGPWNGSFLFQDNKESPTIKLYFNSGGLSLNSVNGSKAETSIISYDKTKNDIAITSATTLSSTLNVTGATTLDEKLTISSGGLDVTGDTILNNNLTVQLDSTSKPALTITKDNFSIVNRNISITGATTLASSLLIENGSSLTVTGDTILDSAVILAQKSYGDSLPTSGEKGQIYFKII